MNFNDVTAVFGGTFDPPHIGHRQAVTGLFESPAVKRVIVIPSGLPPHKNHSSATTEHRIRMTELCFENLPNVEVDLREIRRSEKTGQPTFSYDTLLELHRDFAPEKLAFVIGADQLTHLHEWRRFPQLLGMCHWIVLDRIVPQGGHEAVIQSWLNNGILQRAGKGPMQWSLGSVCEPRSPELVLQIAHTEAMKISSSQIRASLEKSGELPLEALHPGVATYLKNHSLYGT